MNIHKEPKNKKERQKKLLIMSKQCDELVKQKIDKSTITCACCGQEKYLVFMYKCFYCNLWFCSKCAKIHFEGDK